MRVKLGPGGKVAVRASGCAKKKQKTAWAEKAEIREEGSTTTRDTLGLIFPYVLKNSVP